MTRAQAKRLGLKAFWSGTPCIRGHLARRATVNGTCAACVSEKAKRNGYYKKRDKRKHADAQRERVNLLRSTDPVGHELHLDRTRLWRSKNTERRKRYDSEYKKLNPHVKVISEQKRRARKLGVGGSYTHLNILELLQKQGMRCMECRCSISKGYTIDHIMPLNLGGNNDISNIQLLCRSCNCKKSAFDPLDWARKKGRLL